MRLLRPCTPLFKLKLEESSDQRISSSSTIRWSSNIFQHVTQYCRFPLLGSAFLQERHLIP